MSRGLHSAMGALEQLQRAALAGPCALPSCDEPSVGYIQGADNQPRGVCETHAGPARERGHVVHTEPITQKGDGGRTTTVPDTNLTAGQLAELREQARRDVAAGGSFVDPRVVREFQAASHRMPRSWRTAVTGREAPASAGQHEYPDWVLLVLALRADPTPPPDPDEQARRAAQKAAEDARWAEQQAEWDRAWAAWETLRGQLPVPVTVEHNYKSARHLDGYVQGTDHILVQEDLHVGRLDRGKGEALCETPSNAHNLGPWSGDYPDRLPKCKTCLRYAATLARRAEAL